MFDKNQTNSKKNYTLTLLINSQKKSNSMFNFIKKIILLTLIISVSACTSTRTYTYNTVEREAICDKASTDTGNTVVLLETAWRSDQKEPVQRQQMAFEEIEKAFVNFPCGNIVYTCRYKRYA